MLFPVNDKNELVINFAQTSLAHAEYLKVEDG